MFDTAMAHNVSNIERLLERGSADTAFVDLGCDDGSLTARLTAVVGTDNVHGLELVEERAALAATRRIEVRHGNLNERFPYEDARFDVVCSNQVIEHLHDTDTFVREVFRVLTPGGYAVTSTENLASWHNIAALVCGWQPFSLTNISHARLGLGNPLSIHRGQEGSLKSWEHVRVFAHRGLVELFRAHGFLIEAVLGAGYFPLPTRVGRLEPRHAAFLALKARRP